MVVSEKYRKTWKPDVNIIQEDEVLVSEVSTHGNKN